MEINRNGDEIRISGSVVKFEDYDKIKLMVTEILSGGNNKLLITFEDALSINSALIGFLIKLKRVDNVDLSILTGNNRLYEMLSMLSLIESLNVNKIQL